MGSHRHVRCPACGWYTSRAPRADDDYGVCCRCGAVLRAVTPRRFFRRAPPPLLKFNAWFSRKFGDGHTWPELVAMELEKQEREMTQTSETHG